MAMQWLERELEKTGDRRDAERAAIIAAMRKARGEDIPLSSVELNLDPEWSRQIQRFIELGFHKELNLSEREYLDSLPKFGPQPEQFQGRFNIPVVVETRIPVKRQCELARIRYFLGGLKVTDWTDDSKGYRTPDRPYATWLQDGKKNLYRAVEAVRKELAEDERGGTEFDGIALYIAHPQVLKEHFLDLPGTKVGPVSAPCLSLCFGGPRLYYRWVGDADPRFGSVSCGREIKT